MSQCIDDRDVLQQSPTTVFRVPKFSDALFDKNRLAPNEPEANVVADLNNRLETTIFRLLVTAQSKTQFTELRFELFPQFVELSATISTILRVSDNRDQAEVVSQAFEGIKSAFSMETWFLERHPGAKEEAIFALETLYRAHLLGQDIAESVREGRLPVDALRGYEAVLFDQWWSLLHLRCIVFAIANKISPSDDVYLGLFAGLRHSVMAYAAAQEALEPYYQSEYNQVDFESITADPSDYRSSCGDLAHGA